MGTNKKKTLWLAVTGLDGSGKTTLVDNLLPWLESRGLRVKRDRLPHDSYLVKELLNRSKDTYTDRLLFALDNRIFGTELHELLKSGEYDVILTQRCFLDSFVHGAVQGYSYSWIEDINKTEDLPRPDVMIHMVAEAKTAFSRICDDPDADKFEYPAYMRKQEIETRKAYAEVISGSNTDLEMFKDAQNIYVDSTQMTTDEVFEYVKNKLEKLNLF